MVAETSTRERWVCLDTADWRLHRAGMTLRDRRRGRSGELVLTAAHGERVAVASRAAVWPKRVEVLAPSSVRDRVAPTVGVRALLPMAAVDARSTRLRLLDDLDKTRVRVQIDQQRLLDGSHAPLPLRVVLTALRGYERDARRCAELLTASMAGVDGHADAVSAALTAVGRAPTRAALGSPAFPTLDPDAPAARSIATAMLSLLDVIDATRPGVADDIDTEFLHDMRTAVRAARSILTLTGDLLPGGPSPARHRRIGVARAPDHAAARPRCVPSRTARSGSPRYAGSGRRLGRGQAVAAIPRARPSAHPAQLAPRVGVAAASRHSPTTSASAWNESSRTSRTDRRPRSSRRTEPARPTREFAERPDR